LFAAAPRQDRGRETAFALNRGAPKLEIRKYALSDA
jgi:hypothetical protein